MKINRMHETHALQSSTAHIVAAYVRGHNVDTSELPALIASVSNALSNCGSPVDEPTNQPLPRGEPAVPIDSSVAPDRLTCLECGKRVQALTRHLHARHGLSPDEYRARWELRKEYPMTAPDYSERRSAIAVHIGLGHHREAAE